ncbi:MAG: hypothetical protein U0324_26775 [Polyangiales bacterium]
MSCSTWSARATATLGEDRGLAKGEAIGLAKGLAKAVLQVAALRGLALTDAQRERVAACAEDIFAGE